MTISWLSSLPPKKLRSLKTTQTLLKKKRSLSKRRRWILGLFFILVLSLYWRAIYLQVMHNEFLQRQWGARHLRTVPIPAHRGMLLDRNGEPLAISTPIDSVWIHPELFMKDQSHWQKLLTVLNLTSTDLQNTLTGRLQRGFVYLKRHISPNIAQQVTQLQVPGVFLQREYRRYYPDGETCAHVIGFTNIDDEGQEGLELALDSLLKGRPGSRQIIQDQFGQPIEQIANLEIPQSGKDLQLSIDRRLHYYTYRELKAAVINHQAKAGSAIILDIPTGEIVAMVNQPAYNPNDWQQRKSDLYRNRAVTDVLEPGSTLKSFTLATALNSGQYFPDSLIDTSPGSLTIGEYEVRDPQSFGKINLTAILQKSSNVGASKIALNLPAQSLWNTLHLAGFGQVSGSQFPGEVPGRLAPSAVWQPIEQATLAFGYGLNATLLQLARAYTIFGNQGKLVPVSFFLTNQPQPFNGSGDRIKPAVPVISPKTARQMLTLLETVLEPGGTAQEAKIPNYRVAGKTGTVHKVVNGEYAENAYLALFVGIVPVSSPRWVMAIVIDEPQQDSHYGGTVAAPVFAKVMTEALRIFGIPPDNIIN